MELTFLCDDAILANPLDTIPIHGIVGPVEGREIPGVKHQTLTARNYISSSVKYQWGVRMDQRTVVRNKVVVIFRWRCGPYVATHFLK